MDLKAELKLFCELMNQPSGRLKSRNSLTVQAVAIVEYLQDPEVVVPLELFAMFNNSERRGVLASYVTMAAGVAREEA